VLGKKMGLLKGECCFIMGKRLARDGGVVLFSCNLTRKEVKEYSQACQL
jgi:hypothetical protein